MVIVIIDVMSKLLHSYNNYLIVIDIWLNLAIELTNV